VVLLLVLADAQEAESDGEEDACVEPGGPQVPAEVEEYIHPSIHPNRLRVTIEVRVLAPERHLIRD
jgi:hypothetical protein